MKLDKRKRKSGWRYRARFSVNYTPFTSPWFKSVDEAHDWAARKRLEVKAGQVNTGADTTLEEFAMIWLEKHAFANKVYSSALRDQDALKLVLPGLGTKKLRTVTTADIEFRFSDLKRAGRHSPKTLNNYLGTTKKMLGDAVRWGYLNFNPADRVPRIKVPTQEVTSLSRDEVAQLLVYTELHAKEEGHLISFALNTGCRLGECMGLDWCKIDFETKFVLIDSTWDDRLKQVVARTKGKRFRKVPLNDDVLSTLRQLRLEGRQRESRLVFSRLNYEYVTHERFKAVLKKAGLAAALERRATFHTLRHTFASEFMRTGGNLYDLQHLLGHSTIQQTERYAHFAPSFLVGATQRVSFSVPKGTILPLTAVASK